MAPFGESSCHRIVLADSQSLPQLIRLHADAMVRYAYSIVHSASVAEELTEDSFAVLYLRKQQFSHEQQLKAYLYKILRSRCMDYLRRQRRFVPLEDVENVLPLEGPEQLLETRQRDQKLYCCLQQLPVDYREVLTLHYLDDVDVAGICTVMGKRPKQVYNLLSRARIALRTLLEKEGITHEDL